MNMHTSNFRLNFRLNMAGGFESQFSRSAWELFRFNLRKTLHHNPADSHIDKALWQKMITLTLNS